MKFLSDYLCIPKHVEVLAMILIALACALTDKSLLEVRTNLKEVWTLSLDPYKFPPMQQLFMKYVISSIVLIRTFTLHAHLACLVIMLWPALLEDRPPLLLPWLTIAAIRYIITDVIATLTGLYIYAQYGVLHIRNLEYLLVQFIEHGPAFYMWFCTYSFYTELMLYPLAIFSGSHTGEKLKCSRRRRTRPMWLPRINFNEKVDDGRNLISESTIAGLLHPLQLQVFLSQSRSMDTLLALRAVERERKKILNESNETPNEKYQTQMDFVKGILGISDNDVELAKREKGSRVVMNFTLDDICLKNSLEQKVSFAPSESYLLNKQFSNSFNETETGSPGIKEIEECPDLKKTLQENRQLENAPLEHTENDEEVVFRDIIYDEFDNGSRCSSQHHPEIIPVRKKSNLKKRKDTVTEEINSCLKDENPGLALENYSTIHIRKLPDSRNVSRKNSESSYYGYSSKRVNPSSTKNDKKKTGEEKTFVKVNKSDSDRKNLVTRKSYLELQKRNEGVKSTKSKEGIMKQKSSKASFVYFSLSRPETYENGCQVSTISQSKLQKLYNESKRKCRSGTVIHQRSVNFLEP